MAGSRHKYSPDRLRALMRAVYRRGLISDDAIDTLRCARLADYGTAQADLSSVGVSVSGTSSMFVQMVHHIYVGVFGRPAKDRVDRYSRGFNAYYASLFRETAEKEISHYLKDRFALPGRINETFEFNVIEVEFSGDYRNLCGLEKSYTELVFDRAKSFCQAVGGRLAKRPDTTGLKFPSARHTRGGACMPNIVAFNPSVLMPLNYVGDVEFEWKPAGSGATGRGRVVATFLPTP